MGCGYWGSKHVRNFFELPNAELGMVCDLSEDRLDQVRSMYPTVAVTQSFDELLEAT